MTYQFKAGDKVRFIADSGYAAQPGATATVVDTKHRDSGSDPWINIKWDRTILSNSQQDGNYKSTDFELVKPVVLYIVSSVIGALEFSDRKAAEQEALRRTSMYGGSHYVAKVVTEALPAKATLVTLD